MPANHNKPHTEEAKEKMRRNAHIMKGSNHPGYKGENAGYRAIHYWIVRELGKPNKCQHCLREDLRPRQYQWANISKKYKRDVTDWIRLCGKCHFKYDERIIPSRWSI